MKLKFLFVVIFLNVAVMSWSAAQEKVKKFCELSFNYKTFRGKTFKSNIHVEYGQTEDVSPFKNEKVSRDLLKTESMITLVRAMNYMTSIGWKYEANIPVVYSGDDGVRVLFSKEFDSTELTEEK